MAKPKKPMRFKEEMRAYGMFFFLLFDSCSIAYTGVAPFAGICILCGSPLPAWAVPFFYAFGVAAMFGFLISAGVLFEAIDEYEHVTKRIDAQNKGQPNESEGV